MRDKEIVGIYGKRGSVLSVTFQLIKMRHGYPNPTIKIVTLAWTDQIWR